MKMKDCCIAIGSILLLPFLMSCASTWYSFPNVPSEHKTIGDYDYDEGEFYMGEKAVQAFKESISSNVLAGFDGPIIPIDVSLPEYPFNLVKNHIEGIVEVLFVIDKTGQVESVKILKPSHPDLDAYCISVVKNWRFKPMTRGGQPAKVRLSQRIAFKLSRI